ncbi:MAG: T9SS C-terminal target domain-containing protein [Bacteroidota bacterium]
MNLKYLLLILPPFLACTLHESQADLWAPYPELDEMKSLAELPKSIAESSGLIYWEGDVWTLNDGGNGPYLYEVGLKKKKKKREIKIKGIDNTDWEALAQDSNYVYIGDFGNNDGNRTDLAIHRVKKKELGKTEDDDKVKAKKSIAFHYPDQDPEDWQNWLPKDQHDFDCEALIASPDSLYLFSKNHASFSCQVYRLPKTPGQYPAEKVASLATDGLITGATWSEEHSCLVLLGYNYASPGHQPFIWLFWDFPGYQFDAGKKQRLNLPQSVQAEAITHYRGSQFLISSEKSRAGKGRVFRIDLAEWLGEGER